MPAFEHFKHPSNIKRRRRRGRGIAAGRGKTSGRGQTGQKSRTGGNIPPRSEGGRMRIISQFPKYGGFKHHSKIVYHPVNLKDLAGAEDGAVIDLAYLEERSLLPKKLRGLKVKLLGDGEINKKLTFKLHAFSHRAKARIEEAGGSCEVTP